MENVLLSLAERKKPELIEIIQSLLIKFGDDATDVVARIMEKIDGGDLTNEEKPVNKGTSVRSSGSTGVNPIAQYKAEKKEKNKKEFDMERCFLCSHVLIRN